MGKKSKKPTGSKKTAVSQKSLKASLEASNCDAIDLIPTVRITPKIAIPRQIELVQNHGCSRRSSGAGLGHRWAPLHQSNYHPLSTTRKCSRSSLLSSVAWYVRRMRINVKFEKQKLTLLCNFFLHWIGIRQGSVTRSWQWDRKHQRRCFGAVDMGMRILIESDMMPSCSN